MHIVIFAHPNFLGSQSMPKYANMLKEGMAKKNHSVEVWTAKAFFQRLPLPKPLKKWVGYMDQFLIFPIEVKKKVWKSDQKTLFVFADHALGPWIPLVENRPHVVHCHDFMAQRSALGEISENRLGFTGKLYQSLIKNGYRKSKNFISVSQKTQNDLHRFLETSQVESKVVYNGLNQDYYPGDTEKARKLLEEEYGIDLKRGFILHVGGNQFYKNRKGVLEIYAVWRKMSSENSIPLIMIGAQPTSGLKECVKEIPFSSDIHFLTQVPDDFLKLAYQAASVFLFPSLDEGFGWPIAEAMASGCPVITTNEAPMNEVGGESCFYIPRLKGSAEIETWSEESAQVLDQVLNLSWEERQNLILDGLKNASRFDPEAALQNIESFYQKVLENYKS